MSLHRAQAIRDEIEAKFPGYRFEVEPLDRARGTFIRAFNLHGLAVCTLIDSDPIYNREQTERRLRDMLRPGPDQ